MGYTNAMRALCFYLYWNKEMLDEKGNNIEYRSDMEEFLGAGMQLFNRISPDKLNKIFDFIMKRAYQCLGKDGFRIPSQGKTKRPISMTLFETLFYYYSLFPDEYELENMKMGIQELLEDQECYQGLV